MDAGPVERLRTTIPHRTAADARRGRSPLRAFRSEPTPTLALRPIDGGRRAEPDSDPGSCHVLRAYSPAGALFNVDDRKNDEFRADFRGRRAIAVRQALACRPGLGRSAARRRSGSRVRPAGYQFA